MTASEVLHQAEQPAGCGSGCCQPSPETRRDVVRELEARREAVERRLRLLDARQRHVGVPAAAARQ